MKNLMLTAFVLISFVACSGSILDKSFAEKNMDEDFKELQKVMPMKDFNLLSSYVVMNLENKSLEGISYREIQSKSIKHQAEKRAEREKELLDIARKSLEEEGYLEKK